MTLRAWLQLQKRLHGGRKGARQRLADATGVSLPAIDRAKDRDASLVTAEKIHLATGGAVELWRMTREVAAPARDKRPACG